MLRCHFDDGVISSLVRDGLVYRYVKQSSTINNGAISAVNRSSQIQYRSAIKGHQTSTFGTAKSKQNEPVRRDLKNLQPIPNRYHDRSICKQFTSRSISSRSVVIHHHSQSKNTNLPIPLPLNPQPPSSAQLKMTELTALGAAIKAGAHTTALIGLLVGITAIIWIPCLCWKIHNQLQRRRENRRRDGEIELNVTSGAMGPS